MRVISALVAWNETMPEERTIGGDQESLLQNETYHSLKYPSLSLLCSNSSQSAFSIAV
jgi:hypothetical protein